jgi:menaquinone-dependent protoporphyrinogen IX oxidase
LSKILVVYYSRTGRTRQIAEAIAAQLNADIEPIQDGGQRLGIRGYLRSLLEAMQNRGVRILAPTKDPSQYDLTILGTPVWAHNMCPPLRAYITSQQQRFRKIAVFCTQGRSGGSKVAGQIAESCGRSPAATLVLNEDEIEKNQFATKLDGFIQSLSQAKAA